VVAGNRSSDEMGHLWLQLLPRRREDRWALQEASMRRRLEKYPGDFVAHANMGAALEARGQPKEAIAEYEAALRARPASARPQQPGRGPVPARPDEALGRYRAAVRAQPDYAPRRRLALKGTFNEALPYLREDVRARPDDPTARNNLGGALLAMGRLQEAVPELRRAAEIDPRSLDAHYNLGRALAALGRPAEAAAAFEQALQIAPGDADSRQALAALRSSKP
jgi:tetratricopeptide (TPR) repeat protein